MTKFGIVFCFHSIPRFFEIETIYEPHNSCNETVILANASMAEDVQDQPLIDDLELEDASIGIMRTNTCTTEFIPRINVKKLRFDPYYVSVSKRPLFCSDGAL